MLIRPDTSGFWEQLRKHLPPDFDLEKTARARRPFTRARGVKDAATLLQLAMAYGGCGMSLRETCAWAAAAGIAQLKGPSLIDRLCNAAPWLGDIVATMIAKQAAVPAKRWAGYRLRALDATTICQPGADRTTWRLHVGYDLATGHVDQLELTDVHGAENLQRLSYRAGDIVRTGWNSLPLLQANGEPFDLFAALAAQIEQESEVQVCVHEGMTEAPQP